MEILRYPDPRLSAKNEPIGAWTPEIAWRVDEMREAMAKADGVGLAAPQVGWNVKLFILGIPNRETGEMEEQVVFDPAVELLGEQMLLQEGCLSFPGIPGRVVRHERVRLTGKTPYGNIDEIMSGLLGQAVQHEMDHLEGILFIDRMVKVDRVFAEPSLRKLEQDWQGRGT